MPTLRFLWGEDPEYGIDGWMPEGMRNANIATGRVIAHDLLEHFPNIPNDMAGEMMALGAMLFVRHDGGYFYSKLPMRPETSEHVGTDIHMMLTHDYPLKKPPRTYRLKDGMEDVVQASLQEARRLLAYDEEHDDLYGPITDYQVREERLAYCAGWMRLGYRKALKRYAGRSSDELSWLFEQIEDDVNGRFKTGEVGEVLIVSANLSSLRHSIRREYLWDENE